MAKAELYLPVTYQQLVDLIKQLSAKQKQELLKLLREAEAPITHTQKKLVRNRIRKYKDSPENLVQEKDAWS